MTPLYAMGIDTQGHHREQGEAVTLRSCPFCGTVPEITVSSQLASVDCAECGIGMVQRPVQGLVGRDEYVDLLMRRWNRRATPESTQR